MNNKLALFSQAARTFASTRPNTSRKLYTRHIYQYPFNYINTKVWPSYAQYRETYPKAWWVVNSQLVGTYMMRFFWTYWFYSLYQDPHVLTGHFHFPDPELWTDEELGIPPDSEGSYYDWLEKRYAES